MAHGLDAHVGTLQLGARFRHTLQQEQTLDVAHCARKATRIHLSQFAVLEQGVFDAAALQQ